MRNRSNAFSTFEAFTLFSLTGTARSFLPKGTRPMFRRNLFDPMLAALEEDGLIVNVRFLVKSGKEATVYACEPAPHLLPLCPNGLVAAKLYRPREQRGFQNDAMYRHGRYIGESRLRRAVANKSRKGRAYGFDSWIAHEANALSALYAAGVPVPRFVATDENAVLMAFVGSETGAAPRLCEVTLSPDEAARHVPSLLATIETMLRTGYVHGDLSPFNLLYFDNALTIIDLPQAVDPNKNAHALELLTHDIASVCDYFAQCGARNVPSSPERIAGAMWRRLR